MFSSCSSLREVLRSGYLLSLACHVIWLTRRPCASFVLAIPLLHKKETTYSEKKHCCQLLREESEWTFQGSTPSYLNSGSAQSITLVGLVSCTGIDLTREGIDSSSQTFGLRMYHVSLPGCDLTTHPYLDF